MKKFNGYFNSLNNIPNYFKTFPFTPFSVNKKQFIKYFKLLGKAIITVLIFYFVFSKIEFSEVWKIIKSSNFAFLFLAMLSYVLSKIISAYRLWFHFKAINVKISIIDNFKLYLLGMYYNLFLPGGIGGDGYKVYALNKSHQTPIKKLFWALILDRLNGMAAIVYLLLFGTLFIQFQKETYPILLGLFPLAYLVYFLIIKFFFKDFSRIFHKVSLLSIGTQLAQVLTAFCLVLALGISFNQLEYLFVFLLTSIATAIPITIGGMGSREFVFQFASDSFALESEYAVTIGLLFYVITVLISFIGIYFAYNLKQITKPQQ